MFTKINLRWEYNNVRIKKEDKLNAVFSILENAHELIIIFLGLICSLATFQVVMNNLLRDLMKTGDMVVFIDDIIVESKRI